MQLKYFVGQSSLFVWCFLLVGVLVFPFFILSYSDPVAHSNASLEYKERYQADSDKVLTEEQFEQLKGDAEDYLRDITSQEKVNASANMIVINRIFGNLLYFVFLTVCVPFARLSSVKIIVTPISIIVFSTYFLTVFEAFLHVLVFACLAGLIIWKKRKDQWG